MADDWGVSITLSAGKGYEAPKVTVHGEDAEEAYARIKAVSDPEFMEAIVNGSADLQALYNVANGLGKVSATSEQSAPEREWDPKGRTCQKPGCGEKLYVVRGEKNGKKWKAAGHEGGGYGHDRFFDIGSA